MLSVLDLRQPLFLIFLAFVVSQGSNTARNDATNHPRLFFEGGDIATLQTKASSSHAEIWLPISQYADQMIGTLPPIEAPTTGGVEEYRNFGNRLIPLAFACTITQEATHCDLAKQHLLRYAAWNQWSESNERSLGLAHMIMGNALAYDWLYAKLSASERVQVRNALGDWSQLLYKASSAQSTQPGWENWWRKSYMQNYFWICNSALGMAGLALLNEDARANLWVSQATTQIEQGKILLDGIGDGTWHEGIGYQNYTLTLLLPFLENLELIKGDNLFPDSYLRNYVLWRVYNQLPGQVFPALAFGDFEQEWGNSYESQNILRLIASRYQDGLAEWMAQEVLVHETRSASEWETPWHVFEFFYYDATIPVTSPAALPRSRVFADQQALIWRTGWQQDALVFGFKSGVYGGRFANDSFLQQQPPWDSDCEKSGCQLNIDHDHFDGNGFYLYKSGYWLAPESIGVGKRATSYHNTMLIDGQGQFAPIANNNPDEFRASDGFLEITATAPDFDYLMANATRQYKQIAGIQEVKRHVLFVRPAYFLLLDNLQADATHRYEWVSHFGENVSVEGSWLRGEAGDEQLLGVAVIAPKNFTSTIGNDGQAFVQIRPTVDVNHERLLHLLYPTENAQWQNRPKIELLANQPNWSAVRVFWQDGSGRSDEVLFNNGANRGSGYSFDGNLALVSKDRQQQLAKIYLVHGSKLSDQSGSRDLVRGLAGQQSLEIVYHKTELVLYGSLVGSVEIYAPLAQQVRLNGIPQNFTRTGDYVQIAPT